MLVLTAGCERTRTVISAARGTPAPYPTFEGLSFEPSAIGYDPPTDRYIVVSDKDFICYRYRLDDDRLVLPDGERHRAFRLAEGLALKLEGMTRLADGSFLAATSFDRQTADYCRLIRFKFQAARQVEAQEEQLPVVAILDALRKLDPSVAWWKLEGLSTTAGDAALLLAVRSMGVSYREKRDGVWLLRLPRLRYEGFYGPPDRILAYDPLPAVGRDEGASSIERDPTSGDYYLLTSWEAGDERREDHGGHLFRLPRADIEAAPGEHRGPLPRPLRSFDAKPEGVCVAPDGRVVVVFDDDAAWKDQFEGYHRSQGLVLVLKPRDLRGK